VAFEPDMPVFTGAELALADTLVLIIDVLMLHGIMKSDAIDSVFGYMEERYRENKLSSSSAMAHYLRQHLTHQHEPGARDHLRVLLNESTKGSA
jgi:hypothetical protein